MFNRRSVALAVLILCGIGSCKKEVIPEPPSIIPVPVSVTMGNGYFAPGKSLSVKVSLESKDAVGVAEYLSAQLSTVMGFRIPVVSLGKGSEKNAIILAIDPALMETTGQEGYQLLSTKKSVRITAATGDGLFRGAQTLFQMFPPQVFSADRAQATEWKIPAAEIIDKPAFTWRGMHLDVSRHFFPKEFIKKYIDLIAMHKMNIFHWHLTDDNGWRIEIKKYPLLTEVSAWRVDREDKPWGARDLQKPGEAATYGGFYSQEDIREIVQYAAERHVTVIPEIEMPGHSHEVFAAYPEYSCKGEKLTVLPGSYWPNMDIFCAGKDETFRFLEDILTEVAALFPSEYVHIGGDEADKTFWKTCAACQQRIREENLKDEQELQSYFIRRIEKILQAQGKKLIGWDEILEGGLAPDATVMSWRGYQGGIEAARQGHDVIMCPGSHCYFDHYQADPETEPVAIGGYTTLKKVYSFRPVPPELTSEEAKHILGGQGNLWTEFIPTPDHAEYMVVPRIAALAEALWSDTQQLDWESFNERMTNQYKRYKAMNVNFSEGSFRVYLVPSINETGALSISLETETTGNEIHYTFDGTEPTDTSPKYTGPLEFTSDDTLKALAFKLGIPRGNTAVFPLFYHKALGKAITWNTEPGSKYKGSGDHALLDGIRGSTYFNDGNWVGLEGNDLDIIIDLGTVMDVCHFSADFLHDQKSWIFAPDRVSFSFSRDGKEYAGYTRDNGDFDKETDGAMIISGIDVTLAEPVKARYVRVQAVNQGICPAWHPGAGNKAWIFADEIVIK